MQMTTKRKLNYIIMNQLKKHLADIRTDYEAGKMNVNDVHEACVNIVKDGNYDYAARWLTLNVINPAYEL